MRHSTKIQQGKPIMWDTKRFSFNATKYRAKLDSKQITVVYEQIDDKGNAKTWKHSFRGGTPAEADREADFHIAGIQKNSIVAQEIEEEERANQCKVASIAAPSKQLKRRR